MGIGGEYSAINSAIDELIPAQHRGRIELFSLPRPVPELNPDEYLNNDLKGQVNGNGCRIPARGWN